MATHAKKEGHGNGPAPEPVPAAPPEPIRDGDTVTLRGPAGGPPLAATAVYANGDVLCRWWGKDGRLYERPFHVSELVRVPQ